MENKDKVYVSFPNEGEISLNIDIVKKWIIKEPKEIGDTVFFWSGGLYMSMSKVDFDNIFKS